MPRIGFEHVHQWLLNAKIREMRYYLNDLVKSLDNMEREFNRTTEEQAGKIKDEEERDQFYEFSSDDYWRYKETFPRIFLNSFHVSAYSLLESETLAIARKIGKKQKQVFDIIRTHTRYTKTEPLTLEAKILKDADSIDYLGAIGIMRAVMRSFRNKSYAGNVSTQGKQILGDLIDTVDDAFATEKGKQIGKERIDFINMFMKRLDKELSV